LFKKRRAARVIPGFGARGRTTTFFGELVIALALDRARRSEKVIACKK
jgi:hypothetical protein